MNFQNHLGYGWVTRFVVLLSTARNTLWHDLCYVQSLSLKDRSAYFGLHPPPKHETYIEGHIEMLKYHYCTHCGMFTAKEKGKCLYCGTDLVDMNRHADFRHAMSSLRTLLNGGALKKLKTKTEGDTFA